MYFREVKHDLDCVRVLIISRCQDPSVSNYQYTFEQLLTQRLIDETGCEDLEPHGGL